MGEGKMRKRQKKKNAKKSVTYWSSIYSGDWQLYPWPICPEFDRKLLMPLLKRTQEGIDKMVEKHCPICEAGHEPKELFYMEPFEEWEPE